MKSILTLLRDAFALLGSEKAGTLYMLVFAFAIGAATFIENDFGTSAAQKWVFRANWFEVLLILFCLAVATNIVRYRMIALKKWSSLMFHSSILIILLGSFVTRYFGYEGMMHIREGSESSEFVSSETFLNYRVGYQGKSYSFSEPVLFSSLGSNQYRGSYQIGPHVIGARLENIIPNPIEQLVEDPQGKAILKIVIGGAMGREEYLLSEGDRKSIRGLDFNFSDQDSGHAVNFIRRADSLFVSFREPFTKMTMATQKRDSLQPGVAYPLATRSLYSSGAQSFVISEYLMQGKAETVSSEQKIKNESEILVNLSVELDGKSRPVALRGRKGEIGEPVSWQEGELELSVSYGSKVERLPFSLALRDFIMERYPGTDNPSSYASEVTLQDPEKLVKTDYRIYMNHILDYRGYRFFQSSFDQDEKGTYLSVNHDFWGTWISYIGYILLTIGLLYNLVQKNTRFSFLMNQLRNFQKQRALIWILAILPVLGHAQAEGNVSDPQVYVNESHARALTEVVVQDFQGRFKPFNSLASEVLRKLSKKQSLYGYAPEQILISMVLDPESWERAAIIHTGDHPDILEILGCGKGLVSYNTFFNDDGSYKLKDFVRNAQNMNPKDQGTFEKTLIKLDEKVNIANMVFTARIFRIFPVPGDPNHTWVSPAESRNNPDPALSDFSRNFFTQYVQSLGQSYQEKNWTASDKLLSDLATHQKSLSAQVLPSDSKIKSEILLNRLNAFSWLRNLYGLLGIFLLFYLIYSVLKSRSAEGKVILVCRTLLLIAFLFHTLALGLRWYVSGHAPWSNGYESMIYIGWTTVMAGLIFSSRSIGGMAATNILAATILLVAGMSWLDPEITPLVPVLRSYWLTIHVSLEAGSYGFLMLGAVIGMINMILFILTRESTKERLQRAIRELTAISEITVTAGLVMVSIGTYLGGVWANESWGRYWGWDAKETWALVTILVYAFILHMRLIPGLQGIYAFNLASLFGFATVIMTYYGVNYYLSGLHSYAAGDPVPIPPVVYNTAILLVLLSVTAYLKYRQQFPKGFRNN